MFLKSLQGHNAMLWTLSHQFPPCPSERFHNALIVKMEQKLLLEVFGLFSDGLSI